MNALRDLLLFWGISPALALKVAIPFAILLAGWLVALMLAAGVRRLCERGTWDERLATKLLGADKAAKLDTNVWIGKAVYYLLMLFVLLAFLQQLGLTVATQPINAFLSAIFGFAPRLVGAGLMLLLAWIIASLLRRVLRLALDRGPLAKLLQQSEAVGEAGRDTVPTRSDESATPALGQAVGEVAYWLVFLLFLPAVLGTLGLHGLLRPVQSMIDKMLAYLPHLLSAIAILVGGWWLTRLVRRIIEGLCAAAGADQLSQRIGLDKALGALKLSQLLGSLVQVLLFVPIAISALHALQLDAVTAPASAMLEQMMAALPAIFAAMLVLVLAYVLGRLAASLASNLLKSAGFDHILVRLGVSQTLPQDGSKTPSSVAADLVLAAVMLFAFIEAAHLLSFDTLASLATEVLSLAGRILVGLAIFALGLFLADLAQRALTSSGARHARLIATLTRVAILCFAGAVGLRHMGLANEIITLGFAFVFGAIAVAVAIAFGLGGRDEAARQLKDWRARLEASEKPGGGSTT